MADAVSDCGASIDATPTQTRSLDARVTKLPSRSRLTPQTAQISLQDASQSPTSSVSSTAFRSISSITEASEGQEGSVFASESRSTVNIRSRAIFSDENDEEKDTEPDFGHVFSVDATSAAVETTLMQPVPRVPIAATASLNRPQRARRVLDLMERLGAEDEPKPSLESGGLIRKRPATLSEAETPATEQQKEAEDDDALFLVRRTWKRRLGDGTGSEERPRPVFNRSFSSQSVFLDRPKMTLSQPTDDAHSAAIVSKLHELVLPTVRSRSHPDLNVISPQTVADLMDGVYGEQLDSFSLIDCRFGYEFDGGNLKGSVSMNDPTLVEDQFLRKPPKNSARTALIFYCEFSANRAPKMLRHVRNLDRWIHAERYPELFYPELYLIDGGYKNCFEKLKDTICCPAEYRTMNDKAFIDQCKKDFAAHRAKWKHHKSNGCASRFQQLHRHLHASGDLDDDGGNAFASSQGDADLLPPLPPMNLRSFSQQL